MRYIDWADIARSVRSGPDELSIWYTGLGKLPLNLMHDTARPYAVTAKDRTSGKLRVLGRYATHVGAKAKVRGIVQAIPIEEFRAAGGKWTLI